MVGVRFHFRVPSVPHRHMGKSYSWPVSIPSAIFAVECFIYTKHKNQKPFLIFPLGSINCDQLGCCLEAQHFNVFIYHELLLSKSFFILAEGSGKEYAFSCLMVMKLIIQSPWTFCIGNVWYDHNLLEKVTAFDCTPLEKKRNCWITICHCKRYIYTYDVYVCVSINFLAEHKILVICSRFQIYIYIYIYNDLYIYLLMIHDPYLIRQ